MPFFQPSSCKTLVPLLIGFLSGSVAYADQFDTIDGALLSRYVVDRSSAVMSKISLSEVSALPALFKETRSALLVVKTAEGNYARVLISPELHKPASGKGEPFPVLMLERFDTFDAGNKGSRIGKGREMVLFDGFQVDLDTGQIVPEGEGGDLRFVGKGGDAPRLEAIGTTKIFAPKTLPVPEKGPVPQPTPGRRVLSSDFAGTYRFFSNGQSSGLLELKVDATGAVLGQFRSDVQGTSYPVTGQVATDVPQHLRFTIKFPRSTQEFDGFLFTDGKGAMAGTVSILEQPFGFFAVREGGRVAPSGVEVTGIESETEAIPRLRVEVAGAEIRVDGAKASLADLGERLSKAGKVQVVIEATAETPVTTVNDVLQQTKQPNVQSVRLAIRRSPEGEAPKK